MPTATRMCVLCLTGFTACGLLGCNLVPQGMLRQSQLRTRQLYAQNKSLAQEQEQANRMAQALASDKQRLQSELNIATQRLDNLNGERSQLQQRYASLLNRQGDSPLDSAATQRFQDLERKYPGFQFDPDTGVSKFHSDILFDLGSDAIKDSAKPLLSDFAEIMNEGSAKRLNILVVGHTDDIPIKKTATRSKHPTNWHLSTNRADAVVLGLNKFGLQENRMGAAGYSMHQPVVPNSDDKSRQQNRRVEIYVLAPDAVVAGGWDPSTSRD